MFFMTFKPNQVYPQPLQAGRGEANIDRVEGIGDHIWANNSGEEGTAGLLPPSLFNWLDAEPVPNHFRIPHQTKKHGMFPYATNKDAKGQYTDDSMQK